MVMVLLSSLARVYKRVSSEETVASVVDELPPIDIRAMANRITPPSTPKTIFIFLSKKPVLED